MPLNPETIEHLRTEIDPLAKNIESYVDIPQQTDFLVRYASMAKHGLIEIGAWKGRSTVYLADTAKRRGLPFVVVDSWMDCDIPEYFGINVFPEFKRNLMTFGLFDRLTILRKRSEKAVEEFKRSILPNKNFDFLFIDGDHKYQSVKQDFELWAPLLERPAIIVFHDVLWDTVGRFLSEVKPLGQWEEMGNIGALVLEDNINHQKRKT
ncbi:MAG: class I SAM-dependent methyltransferase [Candidatus Zixiibacteriota bacterium]